MMVHSDKSSPLSCGRSWLAIEFDATTPSKTTSPANLSSVNQIDKRLLRPLGQARSSLLDTATFQCGWLAVTRIATLAATVAVCCLLGACSGARQSDAAHQSASGRSYETIADLYSAIKHGVHCDSPSPVATAAAGVKAQSTCALRSGALTLTLWRGAAARDDGVKLLADQKAEGLPYCLIVGQGEKANWSVDASDDQTACNEIQAGLGGRKVAGTGHAQAADDTAASESQVAPTTAPAEPPYTFSCDDPNDFSVPAQTFNSLAEAWASPTKWTDCTATLNSSYQLTATDQAAIAVDAKSGMSEGGTQDLATMLGLCADTGYQPGDDIPAVDAAELQGVLLLCPSAPQAAQMREVADGDFMEDGTYVVGKTVKSGTWTTDAKVENCYWERTTADGATIANDFVTFAPNGVRVSIQPSDGGFVSQGCGYWHFVG